MYKILFWKDHVTDQSGRVIQQGTNLSQDNFNRQELGIFEASIIADCAALMARVDADDAKNNEIIRIDKTLTEGSNSIALPAGKARNNTDYTVIVVYTDSAQTGYAAVTAKQANGFTVNATSTPKVQFVVQGGML